MHRLTVPAAALGMLALAACTPAVPVAPATEWKEAESAALGIRFQHPDTLTLSGEDTDIPSSEWESPSGPVYGSLVLEEAAPSEPGVWTLPQGFFAEFQRTPSCDLVTRANVYLPVNFGREHACDVLKREDGTYALYAVGFGRPQDDYMFRESIILLPNIGQAVLLQGIAPLVPYPAVAQEIIDAAPDAEPGSEEFLQTDVAVQQALDTDIGDPSPDVRSAMTALWRIAGSIMR
jgi:hypothetical protein